MAAAGLDLSAIDLISPDRYVDFGYPHDAWKWLRENDPVRFIEREAGSSYWAITKHADIL